MDLENNLQETNQTETPAFCNGCGKQLKPGQTFCPGCGKAISPSGAKTPSAPDAAAKPPKKRVSKKKIFIPVIALILVVALAITGFKVYEHFMPNQEDTYLQAVAAYNEGDYKTAFPLFRELFETADQWESEEDYYDEDYYDEDYDDEGPVFTIDICEQYMVDSLTFWVEQLLETGTVEDINEFFRIIGCQNTWDGVTNERADGKVHTNPTPLTEEFMVTTIYDQVYNYCENHTNVSYWFNNGNILAPELPLVKLKQMLSALPLDHEDTRVTLNFLNLLYLPSGTGCTTQEVFKDNGTAVDNAMSSLLSRVVDDLIVSNGAIEYFLEGYWFGQHNVGYSSERGVYLEFINNENGTVMNTDMPMPAKPYSTDHWDIDNCILAWYNKNNALLERICKITVDSYNEISVLCYEDGSVYHLTRQ